MSSGMAQRSADKLPFLSCRAYMFFKIVFAAAERSDALPFDSLEAMNVFKFMYMHMSDSAVNYIHSISLRISYDYHL